MTTTDTTALTERIARALVLSPYVRGQLSKIGSVMKRREAERIAQVAAVLPIVEAEVRKAKAEALREAAGDIVWSADVLPHMTPHDAARGLVHRADRIETGDSDDRR